MWEKLVGMPLPWLPAYYILKGVNVLFKKYESWGIL
jgi:hypothetical protein